MKSMNADRAGLLDGYLNSRDLIDGGGAGRSGAAFEGGGLLSLLANAFAKPLGSQQARAAAPVVSPAVSTNAPRQAIAPAMPAPMAASAPVQAMPLGPASMPTAPMQPPMPQPGYAPEVFVPQMQPPRERQPTVGMSTSPQMPDAPPQMPLPQGAAMNAAPASVVDRFEEYLASMPGAQGLQDQFNRDPAALETLMMQWVRNGYRLPGGR